MDRGRAAINQSATDAKKPRGEEHRTDGPGRNEITAGIEKKQVDPASAGKEPINRAPESNKSANREITNRPALTQSDTANRRSTENNVIPRKATSGPKNPSDRPPNRSPPTSAAPGDNAIGLSRSGGAISGSNRDDRNGQHTKRQPDRPNETNPPRSNVDLSTNSPDLSSVTRSVDEQLKTQREARETKKDPWAERVRDVVRGAPRENSDANAPRRDAASDDPRLGTSTPREQGLTQSSHRGPALDSTSGPNAPDEGQRAESRRSFATSQNEANRRRNQDQNPPGPELGGAQPGRSPRSNYDSLLQHGQTLSRGSVRERPGAVDQDGNIDPRKAKDPIGSIGYGASPQRFGALRAFGPLGQPSGAGRGTAAGADRQSSPGGLMSGGLPRWQTSSRPQLPHLPHRFGPSRNTDPTSRTYDPNRGY
ncbi:MAG: hypothetical protein IT427_12270 [Pirellulales bacterium]|nr:hypothetical protein [Pirellulales bacterium]